jgi:hypothetical protein
MRNVLDMRVVTITHLSQNGARAMLRMKTRIIGKDFRGLLAHRHLLNPARHGALAIGLWSHKLLRWLVPYFLLAILASNLCLLDRSVFRVTLGLQTVFYVLAIAGLFTRSPARLRFLSLAASFCLVNFAALLGTLRCVAGRTSGSWTPARPAPSCAATPAQRQS